MIIDSIVGWFVSLFPFVCFGVLIVFVCAVWSVLKAEKKRKKLIESLAVKDNEKGE